MLSRESSGETWARIIVFSPETGIIHFLQRQSQKVANTTLDLFDRISAELERRDGSATRFSREIQILRRLPGLGRNYESLRESCQFARILMDNPVHDESWQATHDLLEGALKAWERGDRADIVALKSLFVFARGEGYAVREDWWQHLPDQERRQAAHLLNQATRDIEISPDQVAPIRRSLDHYIRHFTEIRLNT